MPGFGCAVDHRPHRPQCLLLARMRRTGCADQCPELGAERTQRGHRSWAVHDPGCVKTHTSAKCEKCNSPMLRRAMCTQQDLTLAMRDSSEIFYARGRCLSFHTAKTLSGHNWLEAAPISFTFPIAAACPRWSMSLPVRTLDLRLSRWRSWLSPKGARARYGVGTA
jgi:hypothetical protein